MRQRGFWFTATLIVLSVLFFIPIAIVGGSVGWMLSENGFDLTEFDFAIWDNSSEIPDRPTMVGDRFYWTVVEEFETRKVWEIYSVDPEANGIASLGKASEGLPAEIWRTKDSWESNYFVGDANHLWMLDINRPGHAFEKQDSQFVERFGKLADGTTIPDFFDGAHHNYGFMLDGKLTIVVETAYGKRDVYQRNEESWELLGTIPVLDTSRDWLSPNGDLLFEALPEVSHLPRTQFGGFNFTVPASNIPVAISPSGIPSVIVSQIPTTINTSITTAPLAKGPDKGSLQIISDGTTCHLYWSLKHCLLYHRGLLLVPASSEISRVDSAHSDEDEAVSALEPHNIPKVTEDWTRIADFGEQKVLSQEMEAAGTTISYAFQVTVQRYSALVGGNPAAIVVYATHQSGHHKAHAIWLKDGQWTEFATTELPYSAAPSTVGIRADKASSYLMTRTQLGRTRFLAIEPTGFRMTEFDDYHGSWGMGWLSLIFVLLLVSFLSGTFIAIIASLLMRRDTATYEYGIQTVRLASVFERGLARTIDLSLLILIIAGLALGLLHTWSVDWKTMREAIYIQDYEHPTVVLGTRILVICVVAVTACILTLVIAQGLVCVTAGKWILGLRTVRGTLKPCGFARSLLREVLLCVESLNLFCWIPAILFMAFTQFRQRFGDLVADTVVVRARSLNSKQNS